MSASTNPSWSKALESLPHGPEFRFLDRLVSLDPGKSGAGEYAVSATAHFQSERFPDVLLVESAAQLAGTVAQSDPQIPAMAGLKLTALRGVKILGHARPGQVIRVDARILTRMGNLVQFKVAAAVEGRPMLEGELTMSGELPS